MLLPYQGGLLESYRFVQVVCWKVKACQGGLLICQGSFQKVADFVNVVGKNGTDLSSGFLKVTDLST